MKYLFIELNIRDGEREYEYRCLHTTSCENLDFAAEWYAAHFWGDSNLDRYSKCRWEAWGGEISIGLEKYKELTKNEYDYLNELFYGV